MDTSSNDVAQATGAAELVGQSHTPVEPAESKPALTDATSAAPPISAPEPDPQLPPAASQPPSPIIAAVAPAPTPAPVPELQLPPAASLPPAPTVFAPRLAPPAETPKSAEAPKHAAETSRPADVPKRVVEMPPTAGAPPSSRRSPPIVTAPPVIAARAGARRDSSGRSGRFAMLAVLTALAAGLGGAIGAIGFAAASKMMSSAEPAQQRTVGADEIKAEIKALRDAVTHTRAGIKAVADNVAALKGAFEGANKSNGAQFAKVSETIARLSEGVERAERMQAEPASRLAKVIETLERLERRAAGMAAVPETTGSVQQPKGPGQPPQSLQQQQQQLQAQSAAPPLPPPQTVAEAKGPTPAVIEGWVLHRVQGGVALIEGRYGMAEVEAGDSIRGLGRVQEIKRQDGRWMVVTARGVILPVR
jgi:hypothetical protein